MQRNPRRRKLARRFAWCKIPFTYGDVIARQDDGVPESTACNDFSQGTEFPEEKTENESGPVHSVQFNGLMSSIQMFVGLSTITAALTLSPYLSSDFPTEVGLLPLIIFMAIGIVLMLCFCRFKSHFLKTDISSTPATSNQRGSAGLAQGSTRSQHLRSDRDMLTLVGLTVFYLLGCVLDFLHAITVASCVHVWTNPCRNARAYFTMATKLAFHIFKILFMGAEVIFCMAFNRATFRDRCATRTGLVLLLVANLGIWFNALMHESFDKFSHPVMTPDGMQPIANTSCRVNSSDYSLDVIGCLTHNSSLHRLLNDYINPRFYPFTMEFTLLVEESLLHLFLHCGQQSDSRTVNTTEGCHNDQTIESNVENQRSDADHSVESDGSSEADDNVHDTVSSNRRLMNAEQTFQNYGTSGGLQPNGTYRRQPVDCGFDLQSEQRRHRRLQNSPYFLHFKLLFALVLVVNAILCLVSFLPKFLSTDEVHFYRRVFFYYASTFWVGMLLAVFVGYYLSQAFRIDRTKSFAGLEYVLLFTCFGPLAYSFFTLIALTGIMNTEGTYNEGAFFRNYGVSPMFFRFYMAINIVEIYFQVVFSLYAGRVLVPDSMRQGWNSTVFKILILYLAVCNGTLWLVNSFGAMGQTQFVQTIYFSSYGWAVVVNIVNPLALFFRFNSCILFVRAYGRIQDYPKMRGGVEARR